MHMEFKKLPGKYGVAMNSLMISLCGTSVSSRVADACLTVMLIYRPSFPLLSLHGMICLAFGKLHIH